MVAAARSSWPLSQAYCCFAIVVGQDSSGVTTARQSIEDVTASVASTTREIPQAATTVADGIATIALRPQLIAALTIWEEFAPMVPSAR